MLAEVDETQATSFAEVKQDYHYDENVEVTIDVLAENQDTILAEVNETPVTVLAEVKQDYHHDENV